MNRTLMRLGLVTVTLLSVTAFSGVPNTDVPLPGTKMQLTDTSGSLDRRNYAALRDGDQSVPFPAPTITGATASIGRVGAGEVTVLDLPASGWSGSSTKGDYKFKSRSGTVISARLNAGRSIRLSARGDAAYPLGGTQQGGVGIIIDVGGVRFCGFFGGTIVKDDGERFVARDALAPAGCPILGTTTTTTTTTTSTTTTMCVPATTCPAGQNCGTASDGCGGTLNCGSCRAEDTCQDGVCSGPGTCAAGADVCTTNSPITCNGTNTCSCHQTVSGATFCDSIGVCASCNVDSDCGAPGWKCVVIGGNCSTCGSSTPLHECAAPCGS